MYIYTVSQKKLHLLAWGHLRRCNFLGGIVLDINFRHIYVYLYIYPYTCSVLSISAAFYTKSLTICMRVCNGLGSPVSAGSSMLMLQKPEQEYLAEGGAMPCWGSLSISILALIYLMLWWGKLKVYFYMKIILLTRHDKTWCKFSRGVWNHI